MIVHNLLLKLQDPSEETISKVSELLLSLQGKIGVIRELTVKPDIRRAESSYDIVLIAKFDNLADYNAYLPHADHVEVGSQIKSMLASAASVCYEE